MAVNNPRESFPILEDASGAGVPLTKSLEGDSASGKIGSTHFAFKDLSGNLALPQLDAQGRIPVSSEVQGTRVSSGGQSVAGTLSTVSPVVIASISLVAGKKYVDLMAKVSSRRGSMFVMQWLDGVTIHALDYAIVDAGQYNAKLGGDKTELDIPGGATTPVLQIIGYNFDVVTDLQASAWATQLA
jgi:hypothetical protein